MLERPIFNSTEYLASDYVVVFDTTTKTIFSKDREYADASNKDTVIFSP